MHRPVHKSRGKDPDTGTTIHVFYAKKMGEKYLERYHKYFADPDICEYDLQHEELLLDADRWTKEVCRVCQIH